MKSETLGVLLHLNYLRSAFVVGMSLAAKHPTEAEWEAKTADPEFIQQLDDFVTFINQVKVDADGELTMDRIQTMGAENAETAESKLVTIADAWDIPVEDLLTVFISS